MSSENSGYDSKLEPNEVARRLARAVDLQHYLIPWNPSGGSRVIGYLRGFEFRLRCRRWYTNPLETICVGRINQDGTGSIVQFQIRTNRVGIWTWVLMAAWAIYASNTPQVTGGVKPAAFAFYWLIALAGSFALYRFLARKEKAFLEQFVRSITTPVQAD